MATKKQIKTTKQTKAKKTVTKVVTAGRLYVTATFNNTLVSLTDMTGNVLAWSSSGNSGFKGTRKSTPFAAITAVEKVMQKAKTIEMSQLEVYIKGPGPGRDASVRALKGSGVNVTMIADVTPVPHNGPRPKKRRRV